MACYILSPVEASPADLAWIEDIRRAHDPQQAVVGPHVTLVFGFETPSATVAIGHARQVAQRVGTFPYRLTEVRAVRDFSGQLSHVFLVPNAGSDSIVALHDALYRGPLAAGLRADIAFIPHVTIAQFPAHRDAERLAHELSGQVDVNARLSRLEVVQFDGKAVEPLASLALGKAAAPRP